MVLTALPAGGAFGLQTCVDPSVQPRCQPRTVAGAVAAATAVAPTALVAGLGARDGAVARGINIHGEDTMAPAAVRGAAATWLDGSDHARLGRAAGGGRGGGVVERASCSAEQRQSDSPATSRGGVGVDAGRASWGWRRRLRPVGMTAGALPSAGGSGRFAASPRASTRAAQVDTPS